MISVGLRIDVDTLRGTRIGVPNLMELLARYQIRASFFFSVGPDNMGRHLWRLTRPAFLAKMIRTGAPSLYGWDILLRGTLGPGPVIGKRCPEPIRKVANAGHEAGLHAWDHHRWQTKLEGMNRQAIAADIQSGYNLLTDILGKAPECFAAPAWRVTPEAQEALEQFPFQYESNCRGHALFRPRVGRRRLSHIQVPTTLPTYDELIGWQCTPQTYNDYLFNLIRPDRLNVLTIHAEVEGLRCLSLFQDFIAKAVQRDIAFTSLGDLLSNAGNIVASELDKGVLAGRDGWLSFQSGSWSTSDTR